MSNLETLTSSVYITYSTEFYKYNTESSQNHSRYEYAIVKWTWDTDRSCTKFTLFHWKENSPLHTEKQVTNCKVSLRSLSLFWILEPFQRGKLENYAIFIVPPRSSNPRLICWWQRKITHRQTFHSSTSQESSYTQETASPYAPSPTIPITFVGRGKVDSVRDS